MDSILVIVVVSTFCFVSGVDVNTTYGVVRGHGVELNSGETINSFQGIPFAKPPVGDLRWKVAQDPASWSSPLIADRYGHMCPQLPGVLNQTHPGYMDFDEDCLTVNIYSPNKSVGSKLYPVMVYFYGGAYLSGGNIQYAGHFLAAKDVVVVVPNYRLGILGFMTTGDDTVTPNLALLDQVKALRFVQENIAAFGGDPSRVTIFGQSAGAASVGLHLVSEKSAGLFHSAICQSGSELVTWAYTKRDQKPERITRNVAEQLGCNRTTSAEMVECLRGVNASTLVQTFPNIEANIPELLFAPVVDGEGGFLVDDPWKLRQQGRYNKVPLISGFNTEDGAYQTYVFTGGASEGLNRTQYEHLLRSFLLVMYPNITDYRRELIYKAFHHQYTDWPHIDDIEANRQSIVKMATDAYYGVAADQQLKHHSIQSASYMYVYGYLSRNSTGENRPSWMGVSHGYELAYVWGDPKLKLNPAVMKETGIMNAVDYNQEDMDYSDFLMTLFTNFAKTGNPTPQPVSAPASNKPTTWPGFNSTNLNYMLLDRNVQVKDHYRQRNIAMWTNYLPWLLNHEVIFKYILSV